MNLEKLRKVIREEAYLESSSSREIFGPRGNSLNWILDLRTPLLDAEHLNLIAERFWAQFKHHKELQIAGLELASVPLMTALVVHAEKHGCTANVLIVRKSRKKYGLQNKIEGRLEKKRATVVVDDLINSGGSIEKCFLALAEEGIYPQEVFCVITFENEELNHKLKRKEINLTALFTLKDLDLQTVAKASPSFFQYRNTFVFDPKTPFGKYNVFCRSNPLVGDHYVYYGTDAAETHALDIRTGKHIWTARAISNPHHKGIWSSPCFVENNICIGAYDGSLQLLDGETGKKVWSNNFATYIGSSPAYEKSLKSIFIGLEFAFPGKRGAIAAVSSESGEILWSFEVSEHVHSSPVFSEKYQRVFCASNNNEFFCLDPLSGYLLWRQPTYGTSKMKPCFSSDEKYIYISTNMGLLYCLESETGRILWTFKAEHGILASPIEKDGYIYCGGLDGYFYILEGATGNLVTKIRTDGRIFSEACGTPDSVIFGNNSGTMYEVSAKDFTIIGRLQLSDRILSKIAYKNGQYFIHLGDDKLMCFER